MAQPQPQIKDIVGTAIPFKLTGLVDCYKPGPGDIGPRGEPIYQVGARVFPQGNGGPCFVKVQVTNKETGEPMLVWHHHSGSEQSLQHLFQGAPLTGVGPIKAPI